MKKNYVLKVSTNIPGYFVTIYRNSSKKPFASYESAYKARAKALLNSNEGETIEIVEI